jgi:sigma-B regulation protein RsbU (phosphoserine phosphatase)
VGWKNDPVVAEQRIPFEAQSGPGWVMRNQQPLIVEDLESSDPTQWFPEWIQAEGFRGHAVVPMVVEEHSIGVLIINDREPRAFQADEIRFLQLMANQAAIALESARLHVEEIERQRLEQEMAIGRDIQLSLLPKTPPVIPGWELGMRYKAARHVGGDFYDFYLFPDDDKKIGFLIGDVSGKGVPAALFMAMCRTMIRTTALAGRSPAQALIKANELILKDSQADLFLSVVCASLNTDTGRLTYSNAGHSRPMLIRAGSQEVQDLTARGVIMGEFDTIDLEEREVEIHPGDLILLYTDGVTDTINEQQEAFGEKRLKAILTADGNNSVEALLDSILQSLEEFRGNANPEDDITIVVARRTPVSK